MNTTNIKITTENLKSFWAGGKQIKSNTYICFLEIAVKGLDKVWRHVAGFSFNLAQTGDTKLKFVEQKWDCSV